MLINSHAAVDCQRAINCETRSENALETSRHFQHGACVHRVINILIRGYTRRANRIIPRTVFTLRSWRTRDSASCALHALRTSSASVTDIAIGTLVTHYTLRTLDPLGAGSTVVSWHALRTSRASGPLRTNVTVGALLADHALSALDPLGASSTVVPRRSSSASVTDIAIGTLVTHYTLRTLDPLGASIALNALDAL